MDTQPVRSYRFAGFELDTARRRLVGADGGLRPLSARGFDVLTYLVVNRHRVVAKDELMQAAWPRAVVEENNLNQAISSARRALGDLRDSPKFIVTVPGRGYQFIGELEVQEAVATASLESLAGSAQAYPAPPARADDSTSDTRGVGRAVPHDATEPAQGPLGAARRRLLVSLGAAGVAAAAGMWWWSRRDLSRPPVSLAVLPFKPLAGSPRDAAIELGMSELLINRLSVLPGLIVAPLSSVIAYGDAGQDPLAAGRELGVEAVLDGHVQMRDGRIRLTARLLETRSGASLWAGDFTETLDDFLAVQDSLASQLANELAPNLPVDVRRRTLRHETVDVEAWQLYASGRYHVARRNEASLRQAIEYFSAAERVDPRFALASAGLSEAWAMMAVFGIEPPVPALGQARNAAHRALDEDPDLPEGLIAMGQVVTQFDRALEDGRKHYRRALQLRPDFALAYAYMALSLTMAGRASEAFESITRSQRLEPASPMFRSISGFVSYFARDYAGAEQRLASVTRAVPDAPLPRQFLARVLLAQERGAEVVSLLDGRNELAPGSYSNLGRALAQTGRRAEAMEEARKLEQLGERGFGVGFDLALVRLALGDTEAAFDGLERAINDHSQTGGYIDVEPALDPIRPDHRFADISRKILGA